MLRNAYAMGGACRMQCSSGKQELAAETQIEGAIPFAPFEQAEARAEGNSAMMPVALSQFLRRLS